MSLLILLSGIMYSYQNYDNCVVPEIVSPVRALGLPIRDLLYTVYSDHEHYNSSSDSALDIQSK